MSSVTTNTSSARCTLVLVRHAHTEMAGTFCGQLDPPLSAWGTAQLPDLQGKLSQYSFTHIFSSDLQRARQTAESIAAGRNLQVQSMSSLRELAFGSWEGLDWDQVMAQDAERAQRWLDLYPSLPAPGGEDFEDFLHRIQDAMNTIAVEVQSGCAAVVTHGGVIRTFLGGLTQSRGASADFSNCDYTSCWEVWHESGHWMLPARHSSTRMSSDELQPMSD
jgi:alpha-ribazole phosphatase